MKRDHMCGLVFFVLFIDSKKLLSKGVSLEA